MNIYEASINLGIWPMVKAHAEIWSVTKPGELLFQKFQDEIKKKYKEMAVISHPDRGGTDTSFMTVQKSYEILKYASVSDVIESLSHEKRSNIKIYHPGSDECPGCDKWSNILGMCIVGSCTGFERRENSSATLQGNYKAGWRSTGTSDGACRVTG